MVSTRIIVYPLIVILLISSWNVKLSIYSPARVVVIGTPVDRNASIALSHLIYKTHTYVLAMSMPETVACLCQMTTLTVSHLLLLPWCTAITGHWISSNNSNSQQQLAAGYRQTSKSLPGMSQPTRVKTPTHKIYL